MANLKTSKHSAIFRVVAYAKDHKTGDLWTMRFALRSDRAVMRRTVRVSNSRGTTNFSGKYTVMGYISADALMGMHSDAFLSMVKRMLESRGWNAVITELDRGQWIGIR